VVSISPNHQHWGFRSKGRIINKGYLHILGLP
jgi:hypothetical protein